MKNKKLNKDLFTPVKKIIKENEKFIITAHETPDGDALGSEAALSHVLKSMGKEVRIFNADPMSNKFDFLTEGCDFEVLEEEEQLPRDLEEYVCMILDTNDTDNIGQVKDMVLSRVREYFIIDHHENEYPIMEGNLISAEASSS
jgi:nanoRNase/pAp phosphatase (c-di-AMP/oligoRNAs hydrolase)